MPEAIMSPVALPLSYGPVARTRVTEAAYEIRAGRKPVLSPQMRFFALLLATLAIPLAAGCGGDEDEGGNGAQATDGGGAQTIQVSATEFAFDPSDIAAEPGEVTFELTNDGGAPHALEIEGNGVEAETETIDGGETAELEVTLDDGEYEIYCPVGNHANQGMVGRIVVGGGAASGGATTGEDEDEMETTTGEDEEGETTTESSAPGY
jgi:plastocyanin